MAADLAPILTLGRVPASDGWRWLQFSGLTYPLEPCRSHETRLARNLLSQPFCCSLLGVSHMPFRGAQLFL